MVLAAGGFEADPVARPYLGAGWEHAKVRGTPHNTGEMLAPHCASARRRSRRLGDRHSVQWDAWCEHNESNRG